MKGLEQLVYQQVMHGKDASQLTQNEKRAALQYLMFLNKRGVVVQRGVDVTVDALNSDAWMGLSIPYWEGPVSVTGSHAGEGYLEMTGYE